MRNLAMLAACAAILSAQPASFEGAWSGTLDAGALKLRIGLNVKSEDGKLSATLDSPDQGALGIPLDSVTVDGNRIRFSKQSLTLSYEGVLGDGRIDGTLTQAGQKLPLAFERGKPKAAARPQYPVPPLPYDADEVTVASGDVRLAGTFTRPKQGGPFPAILLVTGSGPAGYFTGGDFRAAYAPGVTLTGSGQSVGLVEFDTYYAGDVSKYLALSAGGLANTNVTLTNVVIDGPLGSPGNGNTEVALDIDMAICMAPGLSSVIVYEAPNNTTSAPDDMFNRIATDNLARQLSSSWSGFTDATIHQVLQEFAAQGQSFFIASGDEGACINPQNPPSPPAAPAASAIATTPIINTIFLMRIIFSGFIKLTPARRG